MAKRIFVILIIEVIVLSVCINMAGADRVLSRDIALSSGENFHNTIEGYPGGRIELEVNATEGPVWIFVLNSDLFVNVSEIQSSECAVYVQSSFYMASFATETENDWTLIILNTNEFEVHVEFRLSSIEPTSPPARGTMLSMSTLYLFIVVGIYVLYVRKGFSPAIDLHGSERTRPAVIGGLLIMLSMALPGFLQLNRSSYTAEYVLGALFWELRPNDFQLYSLTSTSYSMMTALIIIGPTAIFAFAVISHYQGRTSKRRLLILGMISIAPMLFFAGMSILTMLTNPTYSYVVIPLPLVLIFGLIFIKIVPSPSTPENLADWSEQEK